MGQSTPFFFTLREIPSPGRKAPAQNQKVTDLRCTPSKDKSVPSLLKIPEIPADQSIFGSPLYQIWLRFAREVHPALRCDGSSSDYQAYLRAVEIFAASSIRTDLAVHITRKISLSVPPPHVHEVLFAYTYEATGRRCYHLTPEFAQALHHTDLRWVEAAPFRSLPDGFALQIPSEAGVLVYGDGEWHPVTDIFVERMTDPDRIEFAHETFPDCPPDTQFFSWEAVSRAKIKEQVLYRNWGVFPIGEDMKLDTMMGGLEEWGQRTAESTSKLPDTAATVTPRQPNEGARQLAEYAQWTTSEFLKDTREHFSEHSIGCLSSVAFIAKWVLFTGTEGFDKAVSRRMPPGFKQKPKASKKAKAIQDRFLAAWGHQFRVTLPPPDEQGEQEPSEPGRGAHASPVRHLVRGFFRNQAYGAGHTLRRLIWVQPFWRGKFAVH